MNKNTATLTSKGGSNSEDTKIDAIHETSRKMLTNENWLTGGAGY